MYHNVINKMRRMFYLESNLFFPPEGRQANCNSPNGFLLSVEISIAPH